MKLLSESKNLMEWFNRLSLGDKLFLYDTIRVRNEERMKQQMNTQMAQGEKDKLCKVKEKGGKK